MRVIKFRGKSIATGEFVYGDYVTPLNAPAPMIRSHDLLRFVEVEPDSVAQLVGLDCDGNEVYDGDGIRSRFGSYCKVNFTHYDGLTHGSYWLAS